MQKLKQISKHAAAFFLLLFLFSTPSALGQGLDINLDFCFGSGCDSGGGGGWNPGAYGGTNLPSATISGIIANVAMWLLGIFGFLGVIGFVISGILYLTAAGSDEQIKKAKSAMTWSVVGVVVGLMGLIIINAADALLSGGDSRF